MTNEETYDFTIARDWWCINKLHYALGLTKNSYYMYFFWGYNFLLYVYCMFGSNSC